MSRTIDTSDLKSLSEDDRRYLAERGQLPAGAEPVQLHPDFTPLGVQLNAGTANTLGLTADELQARLDRLAELEAKEAEKNRETDEKEMERQKAGTSAVEAARSRSEASDSDEPEQYKSEDGWTDERLQEELTNRGLNADGERKVLRARLIKHDRSQA